MTARRFLGPLLDESAAAVENDRTVGLMSVLYGRLTLFLPGTVADVDDALLYCFIYNASVQVKSAVVNGCP